MANTRATFSSKLLQNFMLIVANEIGEKNLPIVLNKSRLPVEWADSKHLENLGNQAAAETYAGLQQAIRAYYGRGARGILQRIGGKFWDDLLSNASFKEKAQAKLLRGLPETRRRKAVLDLLIRLLNASSDEMSVHTLDLNLLLVDNTSPTTYNQQDDEAICHLTHGLIREAIYWATSSDALIEEISCQVTGAKHCEFKITFGE
ncbi:MAG: hypothetical protein HN736_12815 [Anaerolineae bacterium]|mgnify:FL=1|jgi:predicted hydrocarbon binding protein|nr:hypothetical protein [Anaerolineae bacterium]MBT4310043.1 hypothetical protein [Anaerolineae bacterium]MBT4457453.1 hypothetical protein [Anaerolineae bacterium]MBT4843031.1 hypothetical protein [Anaerolineae bacterium]MBT6061593.1 hypothetical protein [Anaerolineae bacterium]